MKTFWRILALFAVMPGSWPMLYLVAEGLMHFFNIPHPHWR